MNGGTDGASHICYATCNRWNDDRKVNVNRNDNDWSDDWWFAGLPQLTSFLTPHIRGVEFCKLSVPAAKHPAYLVHFIRECGVFFRIK